ncbi:tail fiber protein [Jejuia spongiicola]|uniref:Tail fiber protein n=1 Tax=Jejuia spongiicola TaxID=2942207 RepID=A0ABT0QD92_9FLAO|nr:tail fiber protein [Jejuia spongiicola]MCL6294849.1 tail fiber protein [Jejuia spongiicola]
MNRHLTLIFGFLMSLGIQAQNPAGNNQEVQFNSNGSFGASPYLKWNGANLQFLDLGVHSAKLFFKSENGDDSYIFSENYGPNQNRLVFHTRDDGDQDYAVFRNRHWNDGEKDVFEIHRTWTKANSNFYVMNGNIGVGTTTPSSIAMLHTKKPSDSAGWGLLTDSFGINNWSGFFSDASNNFNIQARDGMGVLTANIASSGDTWLNGGNVGIGTTNPDSKLTVAGNIHAQEVKVTVNAGADFVFNDDYKLPSLKEVEQFIKTNNHLPEIASEKEMQDNGLFLAEMNIKLLQKIEELTLYTIQQEKQLEKQETINQELINRLKKLENLLFNKNN